MGDWLNRPICPWESWELWGSMGAILGSPAGGFSWQEFMDSPRSILEKPGDQLQGARNVLWLVVSSIPSRGLGLLLCIPLLGMMQKEPQMVGAWDVLWPWVYHIIFFHPSGIWDDPIGSCLWDRLNATTSQLCLGKRAAPNSSPSTSTCDLFVPRHISVWYTSGSQSGWVLESTEVWASPSLQKSVPCCSLRYLPDHPWVQPWMIAIIVGLTSHPKHWQGTPL